MRAPRRAAEAVRFEFGANWRSFIQHVDEPRIAAAEASLLAMIGGREVVEGRTFLDVGSGSGLMSLAAARLGAARVHAFDYDPNSVATTAEMKRRFAPDGVPWTVERGDVLDGAYVESLGRWDIVYSWGVLHHTGRLWDAVANACALVAPGGVLYIAIYNDQGARTRAWRRVKRVCSGSAAGRAAVLTAFVPYFAARGFAGDLLHLRNPLRRYRDYRSQRGMSLVHDWIDWLGGYPFEAAQPGEIVRFVSERGFGLRNQRTTATWGCNELVFSAEPKQ